MSVKINVNELSPNELVSWFLISCYAYYQVGKPVISDQEFDLIVDRLKAVYDKADHPHKSLITEEHLNATTGYDLAYPSIVKQCAMELIGAA